MTAASPPQAPAFPPAIASAVRESAVAFFSSYCGIDPAEKADGPAGASGAGIMGVISFFGDQTWSFSLVLPEATAVFAAKAFAGFDIPFDSPDMGDLVGEMANVMAGDIVARLEAKGIKGQMSLPTVARGQDVELLTPASACTERIKFASPTGGFWFRLIKAREAGTWARRSGG